MSTTNKIVVEKYPFIVELKVPFEWGGEMLRELRFRQPLGIDLMRANVKFGGGSLDIQDTLKVASYVSEYGATLFERLPADAAWDVATLMGKSLDAALQTGQKSSDTSPQPSETPEVG